LFQALELAGDPPLTDVLIHLWMAIRKLGEQSLKCISDENSVTRVMDIYRQLMPEIKQCVMKEQRTTEKLNEVNND